MSAAITKRILLFFLPFLLALFWAERTSAAFPRPAATAAHDSVPDTYFIPDSFYAAWDMSLKDATNPFMKVWTNGDVNNKIYALNDIRLVFDNKKQAGKYFSKNLKTNSENGVEIQPGITIPGVQQLHIFKENDQMTLENQKAHKDERYYFFLFLVDNVYVKVFVCTRPDVKVEEASAFATEAARAVKKALGK